MSDWYDVTGNPTTGAFGSSTIMRTEFTAVQTAFAKLPALTGNGSKILAVNSGGTAVEAVTSISVAQGGTGVGTITAGELVLGNGTGAVTSLAVTTDGAILIGDGAGAPTTLNAFTSATGQLKHEYGGIEANISAIGDGGMLVGTGAGTMAIRANALTAGADGFLKHEIGGLEADISAITDGDFIVGTGVGTLGLESGNTAKTSLGLGTGNTPQFAGLELGHASDTTLARSSAGNVTIEGNIIYRAGGTDVAVTDGGTGSSTAAGARSNLGLAIGTDVQAYNANILTLKSNLSASAAPTVNDDSGSGYAVGSLWVDTTNDKAYMCLDATVAAAFWLGIVPGDVSAGVITFTPDTAPTTLDKILNSYHYDTIAELQANTDTGVRRAYVAGHTSAGDGGGGWFWFDTSDTSTADDNGMNVVDSQSVRAGTWKRFAPENMRVAKWFGTVEDGSTDDSTAMQACIDSLSGKSGTIIIEGRLAASALDIALPAQGITFQGKGSWITDKTKGSWLINNNTTNMFTSSGSGTMVGIHFKNLSFGQSSASQGDIIGFSNSVDKFTLDDVYFLLSNPASKFIDLDVISVANCEFNRVKGATAAGNSVPAIELVAGSGGGNFFAVSFNTVMINNNATSTAPIIYMEDNSGGSTSFGVSFTDVILEFGAVAGGIHLYSIQHPYFESVIGDDSTSIGAPTILVDASAVASSLEPLGSTFVNCWIRDGDATYPDVQVTHGGAGTQTTFIGGSLNYIDTGTKAAVAIGTTISNDVSTNPAVHLFSGNINIPSTSNITFAEGMSVPEIQMGTTGVISAGGNEVVTFANTFSNTPKVTVSHVGTTDKGGPAQQSGASTMQVTIYNHGTASSVIDWIAVATH